MNDDWNDWNKTPFHFEGNPVVVGKDSDPALRQIKITEDWLSGVQTILDMPISAILRPPQTCRVWCCTTRGFIDKPTPITPRQAALRHANVLSDTLTQARTAFEHACITAKYGGFSFGGWGDQPPRLFVKRLPPDDLTNRLDLVKLKLRRYRHAIRKKLARLRNDLRELEQHSQGDVFQCNHLRHLIHEPAPLVTRVKRDATGVWWTITDVVTQ